MTSNHGMQEGDKLRVNNEDYTVLRIEDSTTLTLRRVRPWWLYALAALAGLAIAALLCGGAFLFLWMLS